MRITEKWSRVLVPVAAISVVLALGPAGGAMAAIHPDGSARNVALRDSCGGANSNLNWSGNGVSTWGIVWTSSFGPCTVGNTLSLYYGRSTNLANDYSWGVTAFSTVGTGYDSGTLRYPGTITYVAEQICNATQGCSSLHVFAG